MLREVAEYPNSFIDPRPGLERIDTGRYTLCMDRSPTANTVQRQRFVTGDVDEVLAEIRALLRDRGRTRTEWEVGSAAQPPGLVPMLLARGLVREDDPVAIALVMRSEPPPPAAGLVARAVQTFEEYTAAKEVQFVAFDVPAPRRARERVALRAEWETAARLMHGVWLQDELVCAGTCAAAPHALALFGGATLPRARGRGAYRALIHARWREAQRHGLTALVTQGGTMSRPILMRLGFQPVGRVEMLLDEFD